MDLELLLHLRGVGRLRSGARPREGLPHLHRPLESALAVAVLDEQLHAGELQASANPQLLGLLPALLELFRERGLHSLAELHDLRLLLLVLQLVGLAFQLLQLLAAKLHRLAPGFHGASFCWELLFHALCHGHHPATALRVVAKAQGTHHRLLRHLSRHPIDLLQEIRKGVLRRFLHLHIRARVDFVDLAQEVHERISFRLVQGLPEQSHELVLVFQAPGDRCACGA
mmetsp:Transcript_43521/g.103754  ORF Transcript_43521/g.103754 Transcript_43521/m.103754 type:complete len:227 (-) Transcript_43521:326-1006(-)